MSRMPRFLSYALAVSIAFAAMAVAIVDDGGPRTNAERVYALTSDYACPVCDGQSVGESDHPVARAIRVDIARLVDEGRTDAEIDQRLVQQYPAISYTPRSGGFVGLVWVIPVVVLVASLAGLAFVFRRWSTSVGRRASSEDQALVESARGER